jgi:hypothetical protein
MSYVSCPKCGKNAKQQSILKYGSCARCKPAEFLKKPIPKKLKDEVWVATFGNIDSGLCRCRTTIIHRNSHHCGHKLSEAKGGSLDKSNLESICGPCNHKMGTIEMNAYYNRVGGVVDMWEEHFSGDEMDMS